MGSFSLRVPLASLLVGLATACASGNMNIEPPASPGVTSEDLARNPDEAIERSLQAKYPGVYVEGTRDGLIVRLRGPATFYGNGAPLYVIDEVPMQAGPHGALSGVNPYDIESIRVLTNPADIGIYGMRGANGVIVITTKRPGKQD
jgi:TonB-dependent SusC/RagA subfamily outer membrane receptor